MAKSETFLENPNKEQADANDYSMDVLEHLVASEENYYANVLLKCLKLCPSAFGKQKKCLCCDKLCYGGAYMNDLRPIYAFS